MSIDYLYDLERDVDNGKEVFACQGIGHKQWVFGNSIEELARIARRAANTSKIAIEISRLVSRHNVISDKLLVPTAIGDPGPRGEPVIRWSIVESKDAAEMLRDIRFGQPPYFALEVEETVEPDN